MKHPVFLQGAYRFAWGGSFVLIFCIIFSP